LPESESPLPARLAAVLILVYPRDGSPHVVFTKRTESVAAHQGQISLPGGAYEAGDEDLAATALREAYEELGVPPDEVQLVGRLDDVYVMVSNFLIAPHVGVLDYLPTFRPDPREVAFVIEVPLERLNDPTIFREEDWSHRGHPRIVQFYRYGEHEIWGATGRVVQLFLASPLLAQARQLGAHHGANDSDQGGNPRCTRP
jgi:8-oxo-dGTP pyrophosphatase MutT (NUDIX family)